VGAKGEEDHGSVRQSFTKAVLTLLNLTTLLTDDKNNPKVPVNVRATATSEIQPLGYNAQTLSVVVGIPKDLIELAL
jgi:hypothetical protein